MLVYLPTSMYHDGTVAISAAKHKYARSRKPYHMVARTPRRIRATSLRTARSLQSVFGLKTDGKFTCKQKYG